MSKFRKFCGSTNENPNSADDEGMTDIQIHAMREAYAVRMLVCPTRVTVRITEFGKVAFTIN